MDEQEKEVMEEILEELEEESAERAAENAEAEGGEADNELVVENVNNKVRLKVKPKQGKGKKDKKNPLQEKVDDLNAEIEALKDKDLRRQAEFENFRKRNDREKAEQFDRGSAHVLEKILPVLDNFERGFAMVEESDQEDAFVDGMHKVYKQLTDELEKLGVTPIEAVGKEFDPNVHNAVMQVDTGEVEPGFVAQEMQKGYMYHDTVLRFSMVAVQS